MPMRRLFLIFMGMVLAISLNAQNLVLSVNNYENGQLKKIAKINKTHPAPNTVFNRAAILTEDFESGSLPTGWTQEYVNGTVDWTFDQAGGEYGHPSSAHGGSYNALFFYGSYDGYTTKLVTPALDLSAGNYVVSYWLAMNDWAGDVDEFHLYYKEGPSGAWNEITEAAQTSAISDWTKFTFQIPSTNSEVYLAFEGVAKYGYGVCLDDISVFQQYPNDLTVSKTYPPVALTNDIINPKIYVENIGINTQNDFDVLVFIDNGTDTLYKDTLNVTGANLSTDADAAYIMNKSWTPTQTGTYTITGIVSLSGDQDNTNDTLRETLTVVEGIPYQHGYAYNYDGYSPSGEMTDHTVKNDVTTGVLEDMLLPTTNDLPLAADYINGKIYVVDYTGGYYFVNGDGNFYQLGTLPGFEGTPVGLAYYDAIDTIYMLTYEGDLYVYDSQWDIKDTLSTGMTGWIGAAIDTNGVMYALNMNDESLYIIDRHTGNATLVGSTGATNISYAQDIAIDRTTNELYGGIYDAGGAGGLWATLDKTTGAMTVIDTLGDELTSVAIVPSYTVTFVVTNSTNPTDSLQGAQIAFDNTTITTNEHGIASYRFNYTDTVNYTAITSLYGYINDTTEFTVPEADTIHISLTPLPTHNVTFTIVDPDNNPVEGATIEVDTAHLTTDANGQATVILPEGEHTAYTTRTCFVNDITTFTLGNSDMNVNITLQPATYTVTFYVLDNEGNPLENAEITVNDSTVTTDTNGQAIMALPCGDYTAYTSLNTYANDTTTFTIAGADLTVHITLNPLPSHNVTFTVTDADNNPLVGAAIEVDTFHLTTDANGQATISLREGEHTAYTTLTCFANDTTTFTVGNADMNVNIILQPGTYTVTFNVVDGEGNPLANAAITVNDNTVNTDTNGQATMELACGDYTAYTVLDGYENDTTQFTVAGADLTVDITLTPPAFIATNDNIKVAPNPANDYIVISADKNYKVEVLNLSGQVLQTINMTNNKVQINLSGYKAGVYILRLTGDNVYTYRIIKQ